MTAQMTAQQFALRVDSMESMVIAFGEADVTSPINELSIKIWYKNGMFYANVIEDVGFVGNCVAKTFFDIRNQVMRLAGY